MLRLQSPFNVDSSVIEQLITLRRLNFKSILAATSSDNIAFKIRRGKGVIGAQLPLSLFYSRPKGYNLTRDDCY